MKLIYVGNIHHDFGCEGAVNRTLQKTEHEIFSFLYPTYMKRYEYYNSMLESMIEEFKPDLVIVSKAMGLTYEMIMDLKKRFKIPIVQWIWDHMGTVCGEDRWSWWGKQAKAFDLVFNSEDCMHEKYIKEGINHRISRQGFDETIFKKIEVSEEDKKKYSADVMFTGGAHNDWRKKFIKNLSEDKSIKFNWYTETYMEELNKAGNCSKMAIITNYDDTEDRGWSNRIAESMGMGMMILSPHIPSMDKEGFIDKKNLVYYKTHDIDDLKAKIKYYLEHEDERITIAENGRKLALETMTWDIIVNKFLEELKKEGILK